MYCIKCGNELISKFLIHEGMIPFCNTCNDYVFPKYNCAVSMIILNPDKNKLLLVKQYGTNKYRLVAGYVDHKENLEHAVYRELGEEVGRYPNSIKFNASRYFPKSDTLISNFIVVLTTEEINPNYEIDEYAWISLDNALDALKDAKLAYEFVKIYLDRK